MGRRKTAVRPPSCGGSGAGGLCDKAGIVRMGRMSSVRRGRARVQQALEALRLGLTLGRFVAGRPIVIADEARGLGLSTTPVREALCWLGGEGLVERGGAGGFFAPRLEPALIARQYAMRRLCLLQTEGPPIAPPPEGLIAGGTAADRLPAWRLQRAGAFPKSVALSPGRVGWWESELTAWKKMRSCGSLSTPVAERPCTLPSKHKSNGLAGTLHSPATAKPETPMAERVKSRRRRLQVHPGQLDFGF